MINNNDFAVLVVSCDRYEDMWNPFFAFFNKFWNDCPFKVYLTSNTKKINIEGITVLDTGFVSDWSSELADALDKIPEKNIILFLEDYFIKERVDNSVLNEYLNYFVESQSAYMKLGCFSSKYNELWPYKVADDFNKVGIIDKSAKYLICLQLTLWDKSFLRSILKKGESPWQFEIEGSKRSALTNRNFLCIKESKFRFDVHGPIVYLCGAVTQGVLMRDAIRMAEKHEVKIDLTARPIETRVQEIFRKIKISLPMSVRHVLSFLNSRINGSK